MTSDPDLGSAQDLPPNPFDFSTPAGDAVFAGRRTEKRHLKDFASSVRPTLPRHLLVHGRRGIGKTSLIGQFDEPAEHHRLVVGHVALDEAGCAETPFLIECVLALSAAVVAAGCIGGPDGAYASEIEGAILGADVDLSLGPLRVARFDSVRGRADRLPDLPVSRDLAELAGAVFAGGFQGLVLVVDEADHLIAHASTAQRLRNLVIAQGQISTILLGTDQLLSAADTSLAPLGRHFTRLEVPPLGDVGETRRCLTKPLEAAGVDYSRMIAPDVVAEVHALTGGRPLEVAMLGHLMYDEMAVQHSGRLQLSPMVLDATAALLRPGVEEITLAVLRSLEPADVSRAARYCVSPGVSLQELALLRLALAPLSVDGVAAARASVVEEWNVLARQQLGAIEGELLRPSFGEWSRLYLKYRAKSLGVLDDGVEGNYADRLATKIVDALAAKLQGFGVVTLIRRSGIALEAGQDTAATQELEYIRRGDLAGFVEEAHIFGTLPAQLQPETRDHGEVNLCSIPFEVDEFGFSLALVTDLDESSRTAEEIEVEIRRLFEAAQTYHASLGKVDTVRVSKVTWHRLAILHLAYLSAMIASALWKAGRQQSVIIPVEDIFEQIESDMNGFDTLYEPEIRLLNNLGFLRLDGSDYQGSYDVLSRAAVRGGLAPSRGASDRAILLANLAAVCAALGRLEESLAWCEDALLLDDHDSEALVLFAYLPRAHGAEPRLRLAAEQNTRSMGRATRASVLAESGDPRATEAVAELAQLDTSHGA